MARPAHDYYVKEIRPDHFEVWDRATGAKVPGYGKYDARYAAQRAVDALKRRSR